MGKRKDQDLENEPFLGKEQTTTSQRGRFQICLRRCLIDLILIIILTAISTTVLLKWLTLTTGYHAIPGLDVKHKYSTFTSLYVSPWYLDPEPSWKALLSPMEIRVSTEELHQQDGHPGSLSLPNGGHLAWLGAFHDLHCVDYVRQSIHGRNDTTHFDHCIDHLRQVVMCRPDLETLAVFDWIDNLPHFSRYFARHHCVDWDRLVDSISDRHVTWQEINKLRE